MANRKKGGGTVEAVWDLCEPIVKGFGLELWDVRYLKEGAQWYLRVYIDRQEGVTIEDCENVSRAVGPAGSGRSELLPGGLLSWAGAGAGSSGAFSAV